MKQSSVTNQQQEHPTQQIIPVPATEADMATEVKEEKEPQIPIKQVPMDGICGGY